MKQGGLGEVFEELKNLLDARGSVDLYAKAVNLATGMKIQAADVYTIGERINNMERMFNVREGIAAKEDRLPERFSREPGSDPDQHTVDVSKMMPEYYALRGWDKNGVPNAEHLKKLGI